MTSSASTSDRYEGGSPRVKRLWSAWPTPDLCPVGWRVGEGPTLMLRWPGDDTVPATVGLEVREVEDEGGIRAWESTVAHGFPLEPDRYRAGTMIDRRALADGRLRLFLAWDGDRPVATSSAFTAHDVTHVGYVATAPEARGRGFGAAITSRAASVQPGLPAMLLAADARRPLYDRLGFTAIARFTEWVRDH